MHRLASHRLFPLLALATIAGCGGSEARADSGATGAPAGAASPAAPAPSDGDAAEVTVAGPPRAGTHRVRGDLACMVYNGLWQAGWEAPAETGLSGLMLQLKEVPASGGSGTKLTFTAVFGSQEAPDAVTALIDVPGSELGGDARGTVTREGKGAVIRIEGTAAQGPRVTAVVRCASVEVMS